MTSYVYRIGVYGRLSDKFVHAARSLQDTPQMWVREASGSRDSLHDVFRPLRVSAFMLLISLEDPHALDEIPAICEALQRRQIPTCLIGCHPMETYIVRLLQTGECIRCARQTNSLLYRELDMNATEGPHSIKCVLGDIIESLTEHTGGKEQTIDSLDESSSNTSTCCTLV